MASPSSNQDPRRTRKSQVVIIAVKISALAALVPEIEMRDIFAVALSSSSFRPALPARERYFPIGGNVRGRECTSRVPVAQSCSVLPPSPQVPSLTPRHYRYPFNGVDSWCATQPPCMNICPQASASLLPCPWVLLPLPVKQTALGYEEARVI